LAQEKVWHNEKKFGTEFGTKKKVWHKEKFGTGKVWHKEKKFGTGKVWHNEKSLAQSLAQKIFHKLEKFLEII
jgi:hypothetical protein